MGLEQLDGRLTLSIADQFETYRGVLMKASRVEQGGWVATCNDPIENETIESKVYYNPLSAFEELMKTLDRIYWSLK